MKLKKYFIYNTVEGKYIFNTDSKKEYIDRINLIAKENEQSNFLLNTVSKCDRYILEECTSNLSFGL